ncbi:uncharacterized protein LOC125153521 [Prionailurus viverrinus]|uniref:uncharacterized protein LOC125153521 n=1 Tax=Prionailurus viverrinus TaxID=61388 RepID=UPI001FF61F39|nr:uncharacterized protein LOC125153521 [Prionailurus viverrinus]
MPGATPACEGRERGRLGPPGSLREEAGAGKEGSRGPAWGGRQEGLRALRGPFFTLHAARRRARLLRREDVRTSSDRDSTGAEKARPVLGARPRARGSSGTAATPPPPARDPAVGKPSWRDAAWNCRGGLNSRRREAAEEFTVERCFVCSQTRCRVLRIPPRRRGKLGKCKLVTQTAGGLSIALRGAGRDGNSAEGRSCPEETLRRPGPTATCSTGGKEGSDRT